MSCKGCDPCANQKGVCATPRGGSLTRYRATGARKMAGTAGGLIYSPNNARSWLLTADIRLGRSISMNMGKSVPPFQSPRGNLNIFGYSVFQDPRPFFLQTGPPPEFVQW